MRSRPAAVPAQSEGEIQQAVLLALGSRPDVRLWRNNAGAARAGRSGRVVRFGVPGQGDLSGLVGPSGRRLEVEVKSATGRLSPEQRTFGEVVRKFGGIYIVARSVEEAVAQLEVELAGSSTMTAQDPPGGAR